MLERVWRKGNPLTLLVGMQTSIATMENSVEIPMHSWNNSLLPEISAVFFFCATVQKHAVKSQVLEKDISTLPPDKEDTASVCCFPMPSIIDAVVTWCWQLLLPEHTVFLWYLCKLLIPVLFNYLNFQVFVKVIMKQCKNLWRLNLRTILNCYTWRKQLCWDKIHIPHISAVSNVLFSFFKLYSQSYVTITIIDFR